MKKLIYLIVLALILGLVLTGCSLLSNLGQVPANDQSEVSSLTKGDSDVDCPAAPAVAGLLLEAVGVDNRWGTGKDGGNFIKDVANKMGPETDFNGVEKCEIENYRLEVAKFLFGLGQGAEKVGELFHADLESVVYEGTCNTFGSGIGETLTLTFSNNVAIPGDDQVSAETRVDFKTANPLGHNKSYMLYTAEGNQVTITVVGTFGTPRPKVGDFVMGLNGIVDALNKAATVPAGGVEVEGNILIPSWTGTWDTSWDLTGGPGYATQMILVQDGDGNVTGDYYYTGVDGKISGTVDGYVLTGISTEFSTDYPIEFTMSCDGESFEGTWSDGVVVQGYWNGTRE